MNTRMMVALGLLTMAVHPASAVSPLSAETLAVYCEGFEDDPASVLGQKCIAYVGGFLDGAVATDERVAQNLVDEAEKDETFTERAFRTRVYGRLREQGPSAYADFCIGQPVPLEEVIFHVIEELKTRDKLSELAARNIVYAAVRKHYPCK